MLLNEYTHSRANKLMKLSLPEIDRPFIAKLLWIHWISSENSDALVSKQEHKHSFFEAHFVFSGITKYNISTFGERSVSEGKGIIVFPNTSHTVTEIGQELTKISIAFSIDEKNQFLSSSKHQKSISFSITEEMLTEFDTILKESEKKDSFAPIIIKDSIFRILCSLSRALEPHDEETVKMQNSPDLRVSSAIRYIEDNTNIFLTCDDVAAYCHFNTKYLNRLFKKETGSTLLSYIHTVKIKEAQRLLNSTSLSLEEISSRLGFSSEYYFNSFFKRITGFTPGIYKKTLNNTGH